MTKGHIKPKAVWAHFRCSQKTNEPICSVYREKPKSKRNKFVRSFFWENLQRANLLSMISDLNNNDRTIFLDMTLM